MKKNEPGVGAVGALQKRPMRRIIIRLATVALGCGIAFILCEVFLRVFVEQEVKRLAIYDPELGWRGRPNGKGLYVRNADEIRVPFQYNNIGFRDNDCLPKKIGQQRAMLLGDSFVENLEITFEDTFPAIVEKTRQENSRDWDIVVVGSQGYSTAQELLAYRKFKGQIEPDAVILFFYCGNDFEDNLRRSFAFLDQNKKLQIPVPNDPAWKVVLRRVQRWLYESSHVVFLVKNQLQARVGVELAPASKNAIDSDEVYKREIASQLIQQLSREVTDSGSQFSVVIVPFRDDVKQVKKEKQQFIWNTCKTYGIEVLDLTERLDERHYFETDIHFNADGHRVVAEAVSDLIQRVGSANKDNVTATVP